MAKFTLEYPPQLIENLSKSNLSGALTANLVIPFIVSYLFYDYFPFEQLYTWLGLHVAIFIARILLENKIKTSTNIHFFLLSSTSLLYGILAWQSLIYANDIHMLLVGMIIASIVAGSVTTLVSVFHIFLTFVLIQLIGLISAFLYMNEDIFYLSAFLATAFLYLVLTNGYKQFMTLKETLRLHEQVNDLLDNGKQGFLSFDEHLKCEASFSNECTRIFRLNDITKLDISELLFETSVQDKELFCEGIKRTIQTKDTATKDIFLSLLPKEQIINGIPIKIECKALANNRFMLILTDITKTKDLKEILEHQNKIQNMIVAVASNKNDFMEIKDSFEEFTNNLSNQDNISDTIIKSILRELHTFKGVFVQKNMIHIPQTIYELELKIKVKNSNDEIIAAIQDSNLQASFNEDIKIINSILGEWFLHSQKLINVNTDAIDEIELGLTAIHDSMQIREQKDIDDVITKVQRLKYRSLQRMLSPYISHVKQMSAKLEKEVHHLEINGDSSVKIAPKFKEFISSLVHLFNNCIDHGIESIDKRATLDKDEFGTVTCSYQVIADTLMIQIGDDGAGIDIQKLSSSVIDKGIKTQEELNLMDDEEKAKLVFKDSVSTKEEISSISGMGVGMGAIEEHLLKLNGNYTINNKANKGVTFTFYLPLNIHKDKYILSINKCTNICNIITEQIKIFMQDTLSLDLQNIIEIDDIIIENNYAQVDLYDGFNGSIIVIYSNDIKSILAKTLIPSDFNEEDANWMAQELPDEILNTVVGLSLQELERDFGIVRMSPPVHHDNFYLMDSIKKSKNKYIQEIQTSLGKITAIVFQEDK